MRPLLEIARAMANGPIRNYATPGLTSSLVGGGGHGTVRLFSAARATREWVTPHNHRFDFACLVLDGEVENILFVDSDPSHPKANVYSTALLRPQDGGLGKYMVTRSNSPRWYVEQATTYRVGDVYAMTAEEIHSIRFSRDAEVLFLEGPTVHSVATILEPFVDGQTIETFEARDWMFLRAPTPRQAVAGKDDDGTSA